MLFSKALSWILRRFDLSPVVCVVVDDFYSWSVSTWIFKRIFMREKGAKLMIAYVNVILSLILICLEHQHRDCESSTAKFCVRVPYSVPFDLVELFEIHFLIYNTPF